jgi:hypothetical protein
MSMSSRRTERESSGWNRSPSWRRIGGLAEKDLALVCQLIEARRDEICAAWQRHFG